MAINTGVNASKVIVYTVIDVPKGVLASKVVVYTVIDSANVNPPVWPSFLLADGVVGVAYYQAWDLTPAASPTTYSIVAGSLPPGLSLSNISGDQGKIDGTPTVAGVYSFTIRATNSIGIADQAFTVTISASVSGGSFVF